MKSRLDLGALAANEEIPSLADISAAFGKKTATSWINTQMLDLFTYVEQPIGVHQLKVKEACDIIVEAYPYINLLEFLLFFTECKLAVYGTFFGQTGPLQVANMLQQFISRRNSAIDIYERRKKQQLQAQTPVLNEYLEYQELRKRASQGDQQAIQELRSFINPKN